MGLSFSVPPGQQVPSSLQNMYKELKADVGCAPPGHGNLEKWAYQVLSTCITAAAAACAVPW